MALHMAIGDCHGQSIRSDRLLHCANSMDLLRCLHGDAMIIIEHAINHVRVYSWRGYEFKPTGKHREYAIGDVKPNYPMPAIRYTVSYHPRYPGWFPRVANLVLDIRDNRRFMRKRWHSKPAIKF